MLSKKHRIIGKIKDFIGELLLVELCALPIGVLIDAFPYTFSAMKADFNSFFNTVILIGAALLAYSIFLSKFVVPLIRKYFFFDEKSYEEITQWRKEQDKKFIEKMTTKEYWEETKQTLKDSGLKVLSGNRDITDDYLDNRCEEIRQEYLKTK